MSESEGNINPNKILNAVSNEVRVEILKLLSHKNPLSFTEIMEERGLLPEKDAGRFGYHLRELKKTHLIKGGPESGYQLTYIGEKVVEFLWTLIDLRREEDYIPVRTSGYTIEHFDKSKIIDSLIREANVPKNLADKIAKETEERLMKANIKYLTAPLIREAVNFILIENGYEIYRHNLTRLGLPPYDISKIITREKVVEENFNPETIHKIAGDAIMEQFLLLNILDRDIADGYLSGDFYIPNSNYFILRVNTLHHNFRWFLKEGFKYNPKKNCLGFPKPKKLIHVLNLISNVLGLSQNFVSGTQVIDFFNILLLPYIKQMENDEIRDAIYSFMIDIANTYSARGGKSISCCLSFELEIPKYLQNVKAIGPSGKFTGIYGDYLDELYKFNEIVLEILSDGFNSSYAISNPSQIFKVNKETINNTELKPIINKILNTANKWGNINIVNTTPKWQDETVSYTNTLERIETLWDIDLNSEFSARGNIDWVILNLPRIAIESNGIRQKFNRILDDRLETCQEALGQKNIEMKKNILDYNNLPFFTYKVNGHNYFNLNDSSLSISYLGVFEAANIFLGQNSSFTAKVKFIEEILKYIYDYINHKNEDFDQILNLKQSIMGKWSEDLVKLDLLNFDREKLYLLDEKKQVYCNSNFYKPNLTLDELIKNEAMFHKLLKGGHATILSLKNYPNLNLSIVLDKICDEEIGFVKFVKN
ncbi:MAG: hypothetical protein EU549_01375 [Promethearchaeota archaeon]|nr:MAG: hypothetical protein EU549_01375 [Candidatus Lokiarchaeota archaeon]